MVSIYGALLRENIFVISVSDSSQCPLRRGLLSSGGIRVLTGNTATEQSSPTISEVIPSSYWRQATGYATSYTRYTPRVTAWGRGEAWSSRRPVKPEVAGSNPVVPAARFDIEH